MSSLYFIGVLPPKDILEEVTAFKKIAADRFESSRALRSPAHITVQPPFRTLEIENITPKLLQLTASRTSFLINLEQFNAFPPRVIYVDVLPSEQLEEVHHALQNLMFDAFGIKKSTFPKYVPHMTIAFKDLNPLVFPTAMHFFNEIDYQRSFTANGLTLFKHFNEEWQIVDFFPFR